MLLALLLRTVKAFELSRVGIRLWLYCGIQALKDLDSEGRVPGKGF